MPRTRPLLVVLGAAALAPALALGLAPAASSAAPATGTLSATYLFSEASKPVVMTSGASYKPATVSFDLGADAVPDFLAYCVEPTVTVSTGVASGTQKLTNYDWTRASIQSPGRLRWVLHNGYGARSATELVAAYRLNRSLLTDREVTAALAAATQSAVWRFSHGLVVKSTFRWDTRTTATGSQASALFTAAYAGLVASAVDEPVGTTTWRTWDNYAGQSATQTMVEVPKPSGSTSSPTPTATPTPTRSS